MEEPDWAKVVRVLYHEAPNSPEEEIDDDHPFVTETDLCVETAERAAEALVDWDLASFVGIEQGEYKGPGDGFEQGKMGYKLTSQGFEVAHQRELARRDHGINKSLVFLTFVLAVAQVVGVVPLSDLMTALSGLILLVVMLIVIWYEDMLK
ncbi:hypothetical protein [Halospeciosus flavus]|uniref:Uncharacterized protein n=1 Tax=Halospeciosus flavus TaxID=3032283 RepID=A0ABD5Z2G0_9EURY|nr:hypothetical protein [Halospeciosus flavus]